MLAAQRSEEMRHFGRIRRAVTLEEKMFGEIAAHRLRRPRFHFRRPMILGLQQPLAAEHLEALVVAVGRAPARVDLTQASLAGTEVLHEQPIPPRSHAPLAIAIL